MKKTVIVLLVLALLVSLCACGSSENNSKKDQLLVGYSRQSITPTGSVGLGGYANADNRMSDGLVDYIYTTCIAFTYNEETILLFTEDLLGKGESMTSKTRSRIAAETGIPEDHIMASGTHTHDAPDMNTSKNTAYFEEFITASVTAAKEALADQVPAKLFAANVQTEGLNFTRHYLENDGAITSSNLGTIDYDKVVDHAGQIDNEMVLVKLDREGEKQDILLMNWAAHPCTSGLGGSSGTLISSDYIGTTRDAFEQETGMLFAFFQGGGGNAVTDSRIKEKENNLDRKGYGAALAKVAVEALPTMEEVPCNGIQIQQTRLEYACNHYGQDRLADAQKVMELFNKTNSDNAGVLAKELGFICFAECRGIVSFASNPDKGTMELDAFRIGDIGFATAPWEMFSETSAYIKDNSPYTYTMVLSIANGRSGYMATKEAFEYVCYESLSSRFDAGGAEAAADKLVEMLESFQ